MTNHLYPDAPSWLYSIKGHGAFYSKEVPASFLQRANFAYYLTAAANGAPANNLNLGAISWTQQGGGVNYSLSHTFQATGQAPLQPAGINRGFSYYLTEAAILPVMSCWLSPVGYLCEEKDQRYSNPSYLGNMLKFDILPATFGEFVALATAGSGGVRLAWDSSFPLLKDGDADGLISAAAGGIDPFDGSVDTDNDGLTDLWELRNHFDPQRGRRQRQPDRLLGSLYGTSPNAPDSDNDGLLDSQELFHPSGYVGRPATMKMPGPVVGQLSINMTAAPRAHLGDRRSERRTPMATSTPTTTSLSTS
ncbi:MAG: hypothetical protein R2867_26635 [Caldilineaceae bacterium]